MSTPLETPSDDPIALLRIWIAEATESEPNDPCAASLATATWNGYPSVRMVLIKTVDEDGLSFYTNAGSRKGQELAVNPLAAICFHWKTLRRQIRIEGAVSMLPLGIVDHYFHSRSRGSQIAAAVSKQSAPLESRERLLSAVAEYSRAVEDREVPLPADWRGYVLKPTSVEFWADGKDRLHDRVHFTKSQGGWLSERLYP